MLSVVIFSGCSAFSKKTGNEPMALVDFEKTLYLEQVWSRFVGNGQSKGSYTRLTPAIEGDTIYAVDYEGHLLAVNRLTGKKIWSRRVNQAAYGVWPWIKDCFLPDDINRRIVGGVAAENGLLLLSTYAGEVLALNIKNGDELWRKQLPGEVASAPRSAGNIVVAQTGNGKIFALNLKNGDLLWSYDNPPPLLTLRGTASPVVTESAVYAGFSNGRVMAFNPANGLILWEQRIALPKGRSELERMVDIHATPLMRDGVVYVGTYQGRITAMARATGRALWGQDGSTSEAMTISLTNSATDKLFVAHSDGKLVAYNALTGEPVWTNEKLLRRGLNAPQVFGDHVAVVDSRGYLHVMNQSNGEFVARKRINKKGVRAPMLTDGETLYLITNGGRLIALTKEKD
jgi:outer membrane protein assembly factor BamB